MSVAAGTSSTSSAIGCYGTRGKITLVHYCSRRLHLALWSSSIADVFHLYDHDCRSWRWPDLGRGTLKRVLTSRKVNREVGEGHEIACSVSGCKSSSYQWNIWTSLIRHCIGHVSVQTIRARHNNSIPTSSIPSILKVHSTVPQHQTSPPYPKLQHQHREQLCCSA